MPAAAAAARSRTRTSPCTPPRHHRTAEQPAEQQRADDSGLREHTQRQAVRVDGSSPLDARGCTRRRSCRSRSLQPGAAELECGHAPEVVPIAPEPAEEMGLSVVVAAVGLEMLPTLVEPIHRVAVFGHRRADAVPAPATPTTTRLRCRSRWTTRAGIWTARSTSAISDTDEEQRHHAPTDRVLGGRRAPLRRRHR